MNAKGPRYCERCEHEIPGPVGARRLYHTECRRVVDAEAHRARYWSDPDYREAKLAATAQHHAGQDRREEFRARYQRKREARVAQAKEYRVYGPAWAPRPRRAVRLAQPQPEEPPSPFRLAVRALLATIEPDAPEAVA